MDVDNLSVASVDATWRPFSWWEGTYAYDGDPSEVADAFTFRDPVECDHYGHEAFYQCFGCDGWYTDDTARTRLPNGRREGCPHCGEVAGTRRDEAPDTLIVLDGPYGECPTCGNEVLSEGPMMNGYWPCPDASAEQLAGLPVCEVEVDGEKGFALTGGGMDLSWEIAEAYVRCGHLPPFTITDLPRYAGKRLTRTSSDVLRACQRSAEVMRNWASQRAERLAFLWTSMEEE